MLIIFILIQFTAQAHSPFDQCSITLYSKLYKLMDSDLLQSHENHTTANLFIENSSNIESIPFVKAFETKRPVVNKEDLLDYDLIQQQYTDMWYKLRQDRKVLKKSSKQPEIKIKQKRKSSVKPNPQNNSNSINPNIVVIDKKISNLQEMADLDEQTLKLFNNKLMELQDLDEEEFQIISQNSPLQAEHEAVQYLKSHKTVIPLGEEFQADIPKYLGDQYFNYKYYAGKERLQNLKLNSRITNREQYDRMKQIFMDIFQGERSQQQFLHIRKAYQIQMDTLDFSTFLTEYKLFYQRYFDDIDKKKAMMLNRALKKKKKSLSRMVSARTN